MDADELLNKISPPLDHILSQSLLAEFIDIERRFVLGDWEPATLNGGQFAEIAARIIYHCDSGNVNRTKGVNPCLNYVENDDPSISHAFPSRKSARHLCKAIRTVYKFRSQRGAIHIDPDYSANELDSTLVMALSRWIMSELLRIFWSGAPNEVARTIREIIRYEVPSVLTVDGRQLVLHTNCTVQEEILLLLHNSGEAGMSRNELGLSVPKSASSITGALQTLEDAGLRQIVLREDNKYALTPNGNRRIHIELSEKLSIG